MNSTIRVLRPVAMLIRLIIPPLILLLGLWAGWTLFRSKPEPVRAIVPEQATMVRVVQPTYIDRRLDVTAFGTVKPARMVLLQPPVSGRLIEVNPKFVPGGLLDGGEAIAKIDPRDYALAVQQAEAALETAQFNLELEQGRVRVAKRDWEILGTEIQNDEAGSRMALREPHLSEKQAALRAASSKVEQASLALERTILLAPFNAMVRSESAEVGQMASTGTVLGTLVGTDEYWVEIGLPMDDVARLGLADGDRKMPSAEISLAIGDGQIVTYDGYVSGLTGSVDTAGRLARVLVVVPSPLTQSMSRSVPLLMDAYVEVRLAGPELHGVIELPRAAVRSGDQVWTIGADDRLSMSPIDIMDGTVETVLLRMDLEDGHRIITSPITVPTTGMLLRVDDAS